MEVQAETEESLCGGEGSIAREGGDRLLSEAQSENQCESSSAVGNL